MTHRLREIRAPNDWRMLHQIRKSVLFVQGRQTVSYDENHPDDRAPGNTPILLEFNGEIIGVARLDQRSEVGIVRLVAIIPEMQRLGHGRKFSELIERRAKAAGISVLRVNAAADAVGFYQKTGWHCTNWDNSELKGIAENTVQMEMRL